MLKPNLVQERTRIQAYITIARPILSYGCEAWEIQKTDRKRQAANEMILFFRRTTNYTRIHNEGNADIWNLLQYHFWNILRILDIIEKHTYITRIA